MTPPDAWEKTEFAFTRLRFRSYRDGYWRGHARWGTDANKSERQFMQGLRRLSRVHVRSVEEIVDIDSDDIFNWPWIYASSPTAPSSNSKTTRPSSTPSSISPGAIRSQGYKSCAACASATTRPTPKSIPLSPTAWDLNYVIYAMTH